MKVARGCLVALAVGVSLSSLVVAQEKKIKRSDLPAAVEKTVANQSQGAEIRGFSEEKENGQKLYEAKMMVNGHTKDVLMEGRDRDAFLLQLAGLIFHQRDQGADHQSGAATQQPGQLVAQRLSRSRRHYQQDVPPGGRRVAD